MAKSSKKKNRKLRRQIRKTIGALFMASAIAVAAIPVQDVRANPDEGNDVSPIKVAVIGAHTTIQDASKKYNSAIPYVQEGGRSAAEKVVYTSGDGAFQFAYIRPVLTSTERVAVILGYSGGYLASDGSLTIPDTLEAYRQLTDNASEGGYCLVSKASMSGSTAESEFLYYQSREQRRDDYGNLVYEKKQSKDADGNLLYQQKAVIDPATGQQKQNEDGSLVWENDYENPIMEDDLEKPIMDTVYNPCYYTQRSQWESIRDQDLYYVSGKDEDGNNIYNKAGDNDSHWRINAVVAYIGEETLAAVDTNNDGIMDDWEVDGYVTSKEEGVFSQNGRNISNLTIGQQMRGIGNYAFYSCTSISSVTLSNGLQTIGNGAFAECLRLQSCNIDINAGNLEAIGKDAFYGCTSLTEFTTPIGLRALGDSCFENCTSLKEIHFADGGAVALSTLGEHLFRGCSSLASIEFPNSLQESDLEIDMFEGCTSLQYVKIPNNSINFVSTHRENTQYTKCNFDWDSYETEDGDTVLGFKDTVPDSFYFEGPENSNIHKTAKEHSIAFKYLDQDLYEIIMYERDQRDLDKEDPDAKTSQLTYQVNSNNELVHFEIRNNDNPINVTIPETIGPYGIATIGAGSFNDNCTLTRITIPASVTSIGAEAFEGCHNLTTVIFTDTTTMQSIGTDAFKTQVVTCQHSGSVNNSSARPQLTFVGAMMNDAGDTVPFMYAMQASSNINNANQTPTWITCHSGWPTNLRVQYVFDSSTQTGQAELVGYLRYEDLLSIYDAGYDPSKDPSTDAIAFVSDSVKFPYVTDENAKEYAKIVQKALQYYYYLDHQSTWGAQPVPAQPTENEMAIVTSTLNVAIPASVDSISPGLFSGYTYDEEGEAKKVEGINPDIYLRTILINGVNSIEPYTFKNCKSLQSAEIIGSSYVGDYAFDGCDGKYSDLPEEDWPGGVVETRKDSTGLTTVTIGGNLKDTGRRPFRGCDKLSTINCLGSNFTYNNGILFRNAGSGIEVVECLEGRGRIIGDYEVYASEFEGVTSLKPEAFADCDEIGRIDLSSSTVDAVPEGCFMDTDELNTVVLPDTVKNIESKSFANSRIRVVTLPGSQAYIAQDAFMNGDWLQSPADRESKPSDGRADGQQIISIQCIAGTTADRYAQSYWYLNPVYDVVFLEHNVYFWDYPNYPDRTETALFYHTKVRDGYDAVPPTETPAPKGDKVFSSWTNYTNVVRDLDVYANYDDGVYTVMFFCSYCGEQIDEPQYIAAGRSATPPTPHDHMEDGFSFRDWNPDYHDISQNTTIFARYKDNSGAASMHHVIFYTYDGNIYAEYDVPEGGSVVAPPGPVRSGYTFIGWAPSVFTNITEDMRYTPTYEKGDGSGSGNGSGNGSGSGSGNGSDSNASASPSASPEATPGVTKYTVSVSGGSGSGQYAAGDIVAINAYFMGTGQNFDKWTTSTAGVGFANPNASSTTFTMPAANVAITATYTTGGGTSAASGSSSGSSGSSNSGNNGGTSVQVTRPGISNEGLAGATVNGSTDNFIVKVTEDQNATNAVVTALQARYGDISRIKYLAMDISLYDSTGRTKIADTGGISVNLTLPIPDDLVQYAGNNKVAAVTNGSLEDLNVRFTTVDGVPCVNFTATHFSPYVIYVDTANLTASTIDASPKTGDPIHPKWFLALGMACISLILFFKREKVVVNAKTA